MKMSEIFHLPVSFDIDLCKIHSPSHNLIEAKAISLETQCYAINNHDRLTEENAKLREFIEKQMPFMNSISAQKAQQLLNQLKDQNNDK